MYTDQVLKLCEECWQVIDGKCCRMALVMLWCKTKCIFRRCTENIARFLGMRRSIFVLNAENTRNVELQFELFDLYMKVWFLSMYCCFKRFTWM